MGTGQCPWCELRFALQAEASRHPGEDHRPVRGPGRPVVAT